VIRQHAVDLAVPERRVARILIWIRPATIGGYAILALLALIYLIPLGFVLFVSLMSSRQFALNAASFPNPIMWSNYPDAWVKGAFNTYFVNTLIYTFAIVSGTLIIATLAAFPIARAPMCAGAMSSTCCSCRASCCRQASSRSSSSCNSWASMTPGSATSCSG
jgi:ABC-type glycerol-3-phosphate transport system permease component